VLLLILELFLIQLSKFFFFCVFLVNSGCPFRKILESYTSQVHDLVLFLGGETVVGEDASSVFSSVSQSPLSEKEAQIALRLIKSFIIKSVSQFFLEQLKQTASLFRRGGAVVNSQEKIAKQFKLDIEAYGKEVNELLGSVNDRESESLGVVNLVNEVDSWSLPIK
jgi:hypothetical protein